MINNYICYMSKAIPVYYHIKKDQFSSKHTRGQFRKFGDVHEIHLFIQNIYKDSDDVEEFIEKLLMIYLSELMCGFTRDWDGELECGKYDAKDINGDVYWCPFLCFFEREYDKEYNVADMK